jgi:anti-sigma-K factor RskA
MSDLFECPRIDDAAGYVLRAMPDSEAESYRHHVTQCEECAAKVAELGFVSHALLSAVPQVTAPPEIRGRVMAVVRAESELLQAAGAGADRPPRPESRRLRFGFGRLRPVTAGAFAVVLIALVLGVGALLRAPGSGCTTQKVTPIATGSESKASGTLTVCDGNARIAWNGVTAPSKGHALVTWVVGPNGQPKSVGVLFKAPAGTATVDLGKLPRHAKVLVTDEAVPDTTVPTLPAIAGVAT